MATAIQEFGETLISKMTKDLKEVAKKFTEQEARYLVNMYYDIQEIRVGNTLRGNKLMEAGQPNSFHQYIVENMEKLESRIKSALDSYSSAHVPGEWAKSIIGIGPVISAGLLAHIDINKAPTAGHIWSYAGIYGDKQVWLPKTKRPWNASLKRLCWIIGSSFIKFQNHKDDTYGKVFVARKILEQSRNEQGLYAKQAADILAKKKFDKTTDAYKAYIQGKLPPAHIVARASRFATKMFLSHWHHVTYEHTFGVPPAKPYVFSLCARCGNQQLSCQCGDQFANSHVHYMAPPNWKNGQIVITG